jgi:hypothetical protein
MTVGKIINADKAGLVREDSRCMSIVFGNDVTEGKAIVVNSENYCLLPGVL